MSNLSFYSLTISGAFRVSVLQKEDWKGLVDLVTNAKQFVSSVQDVARRLADYTKFRKMSEASGKCLECLGVIVL